jgi:heme d1 biosynthesis radical SAM protein NirJ
VFRITQYLQLAARPASTPTMALAAPTQRSGPVVIWNLIRRCNLSCRHCYAFSADIDFPGELSTEEALAVLDDLAGCGVPALILSGGEPLLRRDLFTLTARARALGLFVALSTNGTLIDAAAADAIAAAGYGYVGISLDGIGAVHDAFRGRDGAFAASWRAIELLMARGVRVGVRFTLNADNAAQLPALLDRIEAAGIGKFYLSHLNYAGRGRSARARDASFAMTRAALDLVFERCLRSIEHGGAIDFVTGNNDADAVYLLHWVARRWPDRVEPLRARLAAWGGNASGIGVANIDNLGNVHPDTYWGHASLGNVRERPFSALWADDKQPLLAALRRRPRRLGGRCGRCPYLDVCNGNARIRAQQVYGDRWAEDPGCYLSDDELGLAGTAPAPAACGA